MVAGCGARFVILADPLCRAKPFGFPTGRCKIEADFILSEFYLIVISRRLWVQGNRIRDCVAP